MKRILYFAILLLALGLAGCSTSAPPKKAAPKEPPKPVGGQSAVFHMFQSARQWAGDVQILRVESILLDEVKPEPGKHGAWRGVFVSPSKRQMKAYTYSVVDTQVVKQGVFTSPEQSYTESPAAKPFYIHAVKTDTPQALEAATTDKEVKAMADKNADGAVSYLLECTAQTQYAPAWRVIFGVSISQSYGSAFVAADSGKFLRRQR